MKKEKLKMEDLKLRNLDFEILGLTHESGDWRVKFSVKHTKCEIFEKGKMKS